MTATAWDHKRLELWASFMSIESVLKNERTWHVETTDVLAGLRLLPANSVQCCVTSPPYWALRDYGVDGQIGSEKTPGEFIERMVAVFTEVRRVLRCDGILWLNMGDSYLPDSDRKRVGREKRFTGLKAKDLIGIPWALAFALRSDGWWLRQWIPWLKRSAMTESVADRPSTGFESIFLLAKCKSYFYDLHGAKRATSEETIRRLSQDVESQNGSTRAHAGGKSNGSMKAVGGLDRAFRSSDLFFDSIETPHGAVFDEADNLVALDVTNAGYRGGHFATFPPKLIDPLLRLGTSPEGCCRSCGAPRIRRIEKERIRTRPGMDSKCYDRRNGDELPANDKPWASAEVGNRDPGRHITATKTIGWKNGCECGDDIVPCLVLDPFNGAGTTGVVARRLGLRYIGFELNPSYAQMSRDRILADAPLLNSFNPQTILTARR